MRDFKLEDFLQSTIDAGNSCWIIGDIHGYSETFNQLIVKLNLTEKDVVVCLGDLIDKGPDSFQVLKTVEQSKQIFSIRGNH